MRLTPGKQVTLIVFVLLLIDQAVKIWIKTHMTIGESIPVFGDWFQIYFIENNGMAFGMQFGGAIGKFFLTALRLVLIGVIIYYVKKLIESGSSRAFLTGVALILVGAIGNVIDSMLYGIVFSESNFTQVASLFPEGGGYAPFMFGKVVDMLYFPIIDTTLPQWFPFKGGEQFIFFRPIFNIADSCITIGVFYLLLFKRKELIHALK
ncbi:Lipoprotein signal peptidase [bioreactor metagenome]|jgi:signal peptidase II|uniref:Lipoprotein signal peptidase n=1 Tax=bioreactor metagenome TaxID=1076179 RepID=A0A644U012_9ZZZZ|nr:lipoprotein signal peptidase [Bacteroidales bacterium]MBP6453985.1 lipoprotein signal peptidase [Bacteroidales bacterium]MBP8677488.1 lipoprotein signal peptidase [Bacteroidales bacterium]MBP9584339.1 lipoprotein signal peptidase [Bacteroidales bacterium]MBP9978401.1 lipoprotein signal peptidase [Bacteroidales bacterium]